MIKNEYGVLYLPPEPIKVNALNGRFLAGHVPHNKGKKWSEWMPKRSQRKVRKCWKNVMEHRPKKRPDVSERCRKAVIAVDDEGRWKCYVSLAHAAELTNSIRTNIRRCCKLNQSHRTNKKTGKINTDYKCNGLRWYYETDTTWLNKITNK